METSSQTQTAARFALIGAAVLLIATIAYVSIPHKAPQAAPSAAATPAMTIEALQDAVKATPNDPHAWARLGEAHFERNEFAEAAAAYEHSVQLDPKGPGYWSALGEARVMASEHDPMPPAAVEAFGKAIALDPKDPRARYFLAVKRDLTGDHKGALDDWFALLADTPPGAPWEADLRRTIAQVGKIHNIEVDARLATARPPATGMGTAALPGPNAQQLAAASALSPSQQAEMARGMVAQLEARLQADPGNVSGWVMLMRSRMTLGEPAKASAALKAAVAANPGAKAQLEGEARGLGVP